MFRVNIKERKARVIDPEAYELRPVGKTLCTFDTETDPFEEGLIVKPFTCGFHIVDTGEYFDFWGSDCIEQFFTFLDANYSEEELLIYVHNGGNFDFYFMLDHFDDGMKPFIINGRLARLFMHGQEFRDSFAAIPVALGKYQKTEIDYNKLKKEVREEHKDEIRAYQRDDCFFLGNLVKSWLLDFGDRLTMASVALPMLRSFHGFETTNEYIDMQMRPYYFGGRVQCFETGTLQDEWKVYDVNSMYPYVMGAYKHPISSHPIPQPKITEKTLFAHINATSLGALPVRGDDGGLEFPHGRRDFFACIHEIKAGIECGLLWIHKVHTAYRYDVTTDFSDFVNTYYDLRMKARAEKDTIHDIFYKLVINSSYGKLAQDPRKYEDYLFNPSEIPYPIRCEECYSRRNDDKFEQCTACKDKLSSPWGWYLHTVREGKCIYARPQRSFEGRGFFNVATAASITSAARSELLRGISRATRPIYCDTDSIICRNLDCDIDPNRLGAWKLEASGDTACIGGKKLYAVFNEGEEIKKASKGVKLTAEQIMRVANGEVVEYANPVPKFSLDGSAKFVNRTIRRTA